MSAPNERRSIARIFAACLIAVCGFFAGDSAAQAQGLRKILIGSTTPSITTLPTEMAAKAGFFKEAGLEPEMITIRSADIIVKALMTGDLDYSTALPSLVAAGVRGLPIRVFSVMIAKTTYVLVSHRGVESVNPRAREQTPCRQSSTLARWLSSKGATAIELGTATANESARAFWEKQGFAAYRLLMSKTIE
jgi:hypothetical protein